MFECYKHQLATNKPIDNVLPDSFSQVCLTVVRAGLDPMGLTKQSSIGCASCDKSPPLPVNLPPPKYLLLQFREPHRSRGKLQGGCGEKKPLCQELLIKQMYDQ